MINTKKAYLSREEVLEEMLNEIMRQPKEKDNSDDANARSWLTQELIAKFEMYESRLSKSHAEEALKNFKAWRKRFKDVESQVIRNAFLQRNKSLIPKLA